jgi:maltooligosyltrehalose trehalohydrolase
MDHGIFHWEDAEWRGVALSETVIYEIHTGVFTPEGTFDAVAPRIAQLKDLGITALELMPVIQFPGQRNWGYDGVYPFSVHGSYGGPHGLKRLVNACHREGVAVILDVVYNHLGPEGNYLGDFGPYFTDRYKTPWGEAINFDGRWSNGVRNFFIENALHWFRDYHLDALRVDAIHGITDTSARPFLQELAERVQEFSVNGGRPLFLIAESDLNDQRIIRPRETGGFGFHAQWCDDFHHALHTLLTEETSGYYQDFGSIADLATSMREGFVYSGRYSRYRGRDHGASAKDRPPEQFVVFTQNHDQVGNRMFGERLAGLVPFESLKLAAGALLLSPYIPLIFMGEEYGEGNPFFYFISHSDPDLVRAVREGRKEEFKAFAGSDEPPDPSLEETYLASGIEWEKRETGNNHVLLKLYRLLLRWRRELPCLARRERENLDAGVLEGDKILVLRRWSDQDHICAIFNFSRDEKPVRPLLEQGDWVRLLDSADECWGGPGTLLPERIAGCGTVTVRPSSFVLLHVLNP